jgi:hypothetical protein
VVLVKGRGLDKEGSERGVWKKGPDQVKEVLVGLVLEKVQEGVREVPVLGVREKGLGQKRGVVEVVQEGMGLVQPPPDMVKIQNLPILRRPGPKNTRGKSC